MPDSRLPFLAAIERKALWLASWTIHNANHIRPNKDGLKIGGHQASSASLATILTALYMAALRPQDRVAVKPHAGPVFHALQYLMGRQTREKLENFRGFKGVQSYPSRTKDGGDVDFSTGSVGLGVAQTLFASLTQDYLRTHGLTGKRPDGRMISLVGDAELDEGNIFEALLEGWKHDVRNVWWIIDYNRQSLDAVVHEGLHARFESLFKSFGWEVIVLKHGVLLEAAFKEPGGERLRDWIDRCPNQLYSALTYQGGRAWRQRLLDDIGDQGDVSRLIERRSDDELSALMTNLGGNDMPSLLEAFESIKHDRPVCFIAYSIKGFGLPLAGHKDNHSGLMTTAQMEAFRQANNVRTGHEWDKFEGLDIPAGDLETYIAAVPFMADAKRRLKADFVLPPMLTVKSQATDSTQAGFGRLLDELAKTGGPLADRVLTVSPDVTVSTNLGAWVNRRGVYARDAVKDTFREERIASMQKWEAGPKGQHLELGIAEMNLFLTLSAFGLSHALFGERIIPIGTLYDPFICRGLDALNYACYQDSRFILAATPSGVTLAPEGGAHQSISTPLIGMAMDRLASFEPAFVDELSVILQWAFDYVQREGDDTPDTRTHLKDGTGGSVYLRLTTRQIEQPYRTMTDALAQDIVAGAYWMREPGPNCSAVIAYTGAVAPEAIEAVGRMGETWRDIGLLAVTSADRLKAGWMAAARARQHGQRDVDSHVERLLRSVPPHAAFVTVIDGYPGALSWLGSVYGHRTHPLGVEQFGQCGTIADLYRHFGIDADSIQSAARRITADSKVKWR